MGTAFFAREAQLVARELLGARLVSNLGGVTTVGVIVETEAYGGPDDPASHAATLVGRTERNAAMFGPAGRASTVFMGCTGALTWSRAKKATRRPSCCEDWIP